MLLYLFGAWECFQYYCLIDSSAYPVLPGICVFMFGSLLRPVYLLADAETRRLCHTRCPERRRMSIKTASHSNFRCIETERKIIVGRHMRLLFAKFDSNFFRSYDDKYTVPFLLNRHVVMVYRGADFKLLFCYTSAFEDSKCLEEFPFVLSPRKESLNTHWRTIKSIIS